MDKGFTCSVWVNAGAYRKSGVTAAAKYTTSNKKVLTVAANGTVSAVAKGEASVSAAYKSSLTAAKSFKVK